MKVPITARDLSKWMQTRTFAVAVLCLLLAAMFTVTLVLSNVLHRRVDAISRKWMRHGDEQVRRGDALDAVESYRTALVYSRENPAIRLRLGEALASAGRNQEAASYLYTLWERQPGDGRLNLSLARLAVLAGNVQTAQKYFHGAIYGVWDLKPDEKRLDARRELIRFLLQRRLFPQAESELIALLPELPAASATLKEVASQFTEVGDFERALALYRRVIKQDRTDVDALAGAGRADFQLKRYSSAASFFRRISPEHRTKQIADLLAISQAVLRLDPESASSARERAARVGAAFRIVGRRLRSCVAATGSAANQRSTPEHLERIAAARVAWERMKPEVNNRKLIRSPELQNKVLQFIFNAERDAAVLCMDREPEDAALLLLSEQREAAER